MSALDSEFLFYLFLYGICNFSDHLFNLRFAAKELQRNSKKCDKQEKEERNKLVAALRVSFRFGFLRFY